ncbi:terpene synthase family protein [Streptomyces sp. NPDC007164]|uniref:terpene synthase family protein n=1 Tax=Streptomyces sp. NPDC007164 TaxID=3156918 RepID=UPI0033F02640
MADPATENLISGPLPRAFLRALRRLPADEGNDKRRLTVESVLPWLGAEARVEGLQAGNCELGLEEAIAIRLETMGGFLAASLILPLFPSVTVVQAQHPEALRIVSLLVVALAAHNELHSGYSDLASGSKYNWVQAFAREAGATLQEGADRVGDLADRVFFEARRSADDLVARATSTGFIGFLEAPVALTANFLSWWYPRQMTVRYQVPGLDLSRACPALTTRPQAVGAPGIACLDHLWIQA